MPTRSHANPLPEPSSPVRDGTPSLSSRLSFFKEGNSFVKMTTLMTVIAMVVTTTTTTTMMMMGSFSFVVLWRRAPFVVRC